MGGYQDAETWQALLGQLVAQPQERTRLAEAMRVKPVTLQRWAEGISRPREANLRALIGNLPAEAYTLFMHLLVKDFPELLQERLPEERLIETIPSEFYARILSNLALTPRPLYRQATQDLLLQQALQHLDPNRDGLSITLALCTLPHAGQKVRSLHEVAGLATPPWPYHLADKFLFLGAESLIGYAVMHAHSAMIRDREEMTFFPAHWTEHERSAAAFPILRQARIAGGLIASSVQEAFFTPQKMAILEAYAHLATCLFEAEDCFAAEDIELNIMPAYTLQHPYFTGFTRRFLRKYAEKSAEEEHPVSSFQVRQLVWQDLEEVLLQVSTQVQVEHT